MTHLLFHKTPNSVSSEPGAAHLAYLIAELRQRLGAMGMVVNEQFEFPITQVKLADALGVSVVHVNRHPPIVPHPRHS
jgi:CRP-like cAMP-binding protein